MLHRCSSPQDQIDRLVNALSGLLTQAIERSGSAVLAVSGGRSPIPLFEALARAAVDWPRVTITLVDERLVAADHADSNAALVRGHLLTGEAAKASFLPLVDDAGDLPGCVNRANARFRALGQPLTAALLGMGDDGHTASLFPEAPELADGLDPAYALPYLAVTPPHAPHARISLSRAALLQAGQLLLSIAGERKHAVFAQASLPPPRPELPISYFIQQQQTPFDAYWTP